MTVSSPFSQVWNVPCSCCFTFLDMVKVNINQLEAIYAVPLYIFVIYVFISSFIKREGANSSLAKYCDARSFLYMDMMEQEVTIWNLFPNHSPSSQTSFISFIAKWYETYFQVWPQRFRSGQVWYSISGKGRALSITHKPRGTLQMLGCCRTTRYLRN